MELQRDSGPPGRTLRQRQRQIGEARGEAKAIRCRGCLVEISDESQVFALSAGSPLFVNRYGFVHEILTVRSAQNLSSQGEPTQVDTWFAGYSWQIVVCARCGLHLGWRYQALDAPTPPLPPWFFGLRRAAIVRADS